MPGNFTIDVILAFILASVSLYGLVVCANQLRKGLHFLFYKLAVVSWLGGVLYSIFAGIAILLRSLELNSIANIIILLLTDLFLIMESDTLKREQAEPVKLGAFLVLCVLTIVSMYAVPNALNFAPNIFGGEALSFNPVVGFLIFATAGLPWGYFCYCASLAHKRAPSELKRHSRIFYTGTFLCLTGVFSLLTSSAAFFYILESAGGILMAYSYAHEPRLLLVLPFTAMRLTVLHTTGGLALFTHTWNRHTELADEDLFSGMLQGISGILKESLKRGDVQEIRLASAIVIAYRNPIFPVAFILVASRPSRTLREGLKLFADRFCSLYSAGFATPQDTGQFDGAGALIAECFPHVPIYD